MLNHMSDPIIILNKHGEHTFSNKAACRRSFGDSVDNIGSESLERSLRDLLAGTIQAPLTMFVRDGISIEGDFEVNIDYFYDFIIVHFKPIA